MRQGEYVCRHESANDTMNAAEATNARVAAANARITTRIVVGHECSNDKLKFVHSWLIIL